MRETAPGLRNVQLAHVARRLDNHLRCQIPQAFLALQFADMAPVIFLSWLPAGVWDASWPTYIPEWSVGWGLGIEEQIQLPRGIRMD